MTAGTPAGARARPGARSAAERIFVPRRTEREPWEQRLLAAATPLPVASAAPAVSWGAGPPVLLVHGWQGRGTQLGRFVPPLVASGRRVVAVDAPGHGDSRVGWFTPVAFAEALLAVQRHTGELAGIVTHSMGASAATVALRGGLRAGRLALIAPLRSFTEMVRQAGAAAGFPPGTPAGERFASLVGEVLSRQVADLDLDLSLAPGAAVLLCHDTEDRTIPVASTRALARAWPHVTVLETTGLGHRDILRDPAVVATVTGHLCAPAGGASAGPPAGRYRSPGAG